MREIKFRAWDTKNKEMVYDIHIAPEYNWLVLSDNDAMSERERPEKGQWEIMQFTGLLDEEDEEVYENDIVRTPEGIGEIKFEYGQFKVCGLLEEDKTIPFDVPCHRTREVLGNIHQNPELLK